MLTRKNKVLLILLLIISLSCGIALAANPARNAPVKVDPLEEDANLANNIAKIFGFSVDTEKITSLRKKQYSYAEIALLFSLSDISHKPSSEVIALRDRKISWKEIAKQFGVRMEQAMDGVSKIMKEMDMEAETDKLQKAIDREPKKK